MREQAGTFLLQPLTKAAIAATARIEIVHELLPLLARECGRNGAWLMSPLLCH